MFQDVARSNVPFRNMVYDQQTWPVSYEMLKKNVYV